MDRLTVPEYSLLMKAASLREVDRDYRNHLQAFLNFAVRAEKKAGKGRMRPVYSRFSKFYDYKTEVEKALDKEKQRSRFAGVERFLKKKKVE